jgi:hypothetical protein
VSQSELLKFVVQLLESLGIEYMLTGSVVSSAQGEPRMTHDLDVMLRIDQTSAQVLADRFAEAGFYVSDAAVRDAVAKRRMFNVLQTSTGQKVDFYVLPHEEYELIRFARRTVINVDGVDASATTVEDTIVSKLRWANLSGQSERQIGDALRVYELHARQLDLDYILNWIHRLGLVPLWQELLSRAQPLDHS